MRILTSACLLLLSSHALAGEVVTYELDAGKSWLWVLVKYDRNALIAGHDHVVRASDFTGTARWDADDPAACDVKISFPVTALVVDPAGSNERAGLSNNTSDSDKAKIKSNFEGKSQLNASAFPSISFQSKRCVAEGDAVRVTGDLSIRGVGKEVSALMKVTADGQRFAARGRFDASHSDWGFTPFTALLGSLRNDDALGFHVDVVGAPSK